MNDNYGTINQKIYGFVVNFFNEYIDSAESGDQMSRYTRLLEFCDPRELRLSSDSTDEFTQLVTSNLLQPLVNDDFMRSNLQFLTNRPIENCSPLVMVLIKAYLFQQIVINGKNTFTPEQRKLVLQRAQEFEHQRSILVRESSSLYKRFYLLGSLYGLEIVFVLLMTIVVVALALATYYIAGRTYEKYAEKAQLLFEITTHSDQAERLDQSLLAQANIPCPSVAQGGAAFPCNVDEQRYRAIHEELVSLKKAQSPVDASYNIYWWASLAILFIDMVIFCLVYKVLLPESQPLLKNCADIIKGSRDALKRFLDQYFNSLNLARHTQGLVNDAAPHLASGGIFDRDRDVASTAASVDQQKKLN